MIANWIFINRVSRGTVRITFFHFSIDTGCAEFVYWFARRNSKGGNGWACGFGKHNKKAAGTPHFPGYGEKLGMRRVGGGAKKKKIFSTCSQTTLFRKYV